MSDLVRHLRKKIAESEAENSEIRDRVARLGEEVRSLSAQHARLRFWQQLDPSLAALYAALPSTEAPP